MASQKGSTKPSSIQWRYKGSLKSALPPIDWFLFTFVVIIPLVAFVSGLLWVPIYKTTIIFGFVYGYLRGIAITAGYHRYWSHRSYTAGKPLQVFLALMGVGAGQGSISQWCRHHRAHHRYVDTSQDPYNVQKGFFHAHLGWIIFKDSSKFRNNVDTTDLKADPIVNWQRQYYWQLTIAMAYIVPTLIAGLCWGDWLGGFVLAGCVGTGGVQQVSFCVNSFAHYFGAQPFQGAKSPRDNFITAFFTIGEGYHNFHHEFPIDYRNGVRWYDYDPTKWTIWLWSRVGLASNLRRFPDNEIEKGRLQRRREILDKACENVDWGVLARELPKMSWEEYRKQARTGCNLVVINGLVHDVSNFIKEHPGGPKLLTAMIGDDATQLFEGAIYKHSNAAHNLLSSMRIARVSGETNGGNKQNYAATID
ncbi:fatty acid desaturase [Aspergillus alliaceus]|uniref:Acyl-CoA desaturase n=1 Tax=Petromyces alliaceus TaxID=209559 RepID=A0A5N7C6B9_PETAA|nr:fatty acid desaturase [Aspergillus alliaceus]